MAFPGSPRLDIVADDDSFDPVPVGGHFYRHLEVHDVAVIILDDEQASGTCVRLLYGAHDLVGRRRGKNMPDAGRIQHSLADKSDMHRLVTGAATGDECDLTGCEVSTADAFSPCAEHDELPMGAYEAFQTFGDHDFAVFMNFFIQPSPRRRYVRGSSAVPRNADQSVPPESAAIFCTKSEIASSSRRFFLSSPKSGTMMESCRNFSALPSSGSFPGCAV